MSWGGAASALFESIKRILEFFLPTVDEQSKIDRSKAEKSFLKWVKKTEISSEKQENENSIDS